MTRVEVIMPKLGEGVIEATITRWIVDYNTLINEDEPIVEIATDKVDSEIPSPVKGKLVKKFFRDGETVKVGDTIAIIETELNGHDEDHTDFPIINEVSDKIKIIEKPSRDKIKKPVVQNLLDSASDKISPFIRFFARQRGITYSELQTISGTGENGTVTTHDVLAYFKNQYGFSQNGELPAQKNNVSSTYEPAEGEEIIELDKTRKIIAEHMVRSVRTAPHVTSFAEADVTRIVNWRETNKNEFNLNYGVKLTYTPVFVEVVVQALKQFPEINVSLQQEKLIRKKYINIGIATALPGGNLIVPVIKDADKINFNQLAISLTDITKRAREGRLKPGETSGGTFTITNLALVGNLTGTPIINQPESAILAVGAIKKKPWVVETKGEYTIGIRDIVMLALSYDHRIIDGALGGAFLNCIVSLLENFRPQ